MFRCHGNLVTKPPFSGEGGGEGFCESVWLCASVWLCERV